MAGLPEAQHLYAAGDLAGAARICQALLQREPTNVDALYLLALIAQRGGQNEPAIELLRRSISLRDDLPVLHYALGNSLRVAGRLHDAIQSYRRALALKDDFADAMVNLGIALASMGKSDEAKQWWQRAVAINPADADALSNLGNLARHEGKLGEAIDYARKALAINPKLHGTLSNLGVALGRQGKLDEAIQAYRAALAIAPRSPRIYSNLLLDLTYHDRIEPAALFAEHRRWNERFAAPVAGGSARQEPRPPAPRSPAPRSRLRIGYVSADFRDHAIAYFIEPVLANHDRSQFAIFCYFAGPREDHVTARLKSLGTWRSLWGVRDEAAAEMIRADAIDILVDLSVHTSGNRLTLFARKPAPVQVTWLGYAGTTGMDAMDYRLTDSIVDPPGLTEAIHSEQLVRLPRTQWCYQPPSDAPAVSPLPGASTGHITFGSATNLAKMTATTLDLWCDVLRGVPGSRFALLARGLGDASTREFVAGEFARRGIESPQLELIAGGDLPHYFAFFSRIDVALDTHPFAGGTTTCHTLWMGVPVVTMTGRTSVSRVAASVLGSIGLGDLVAGSPREFVEIATKLANDPARLSDLRASMRNRMHRSPLTNAAGFARDLESAYREMLRRREHIG